MPNTVRLHRVLATSPEKVYRAFLEADALAKWLPPNGFACTVHHLEPKVGGTFKMSFRNFTTGQSHVFGGEYVELVPDERLRYTDKFDDPNLPGEMSGDIAGPQCLLQIEAAEQQGKDDLHLTDRAHQPDRGKREGGEPTGRAQRGQRAHPG
jgi:uncharacterized protein YndB with AHSA1/START domain